MEESKFDGLQQKSMADCPRWQRNLSYLSSVIEFGTIVPFGHFLMADSTTPSHSALMFNPDSGAHAIPSPTRFRSRLCSFTLPLSKHNAIAYVNARRSVGSLSLRGVTFGRAKSRSKNDARSVFSSPWTGRSHV